MKFEIQTKILANIAYLNFFSCLYVTEKRGKIMQNLIYLRLGLYDLSQGTKIKFIRVFRYLTQDNISEDLGITGKNNKKIVI